MEKIAVIGLDGVGWNVLDRLFERDSMPSLQSLVEKSVRGILKSTIPPATPTAWTSMATGVNPGKHGIFDFVVSRENRLATALDVQCPRIHEMVALGGKKSVCINQPLTYPIIKLKKSYLISDWLSPELHYHPEALQEYCSLQYFDPKEHFSTDISSMAGTLQPKVASVKALMDRIDWNLFWIVFSEPDVVFHKHFADVLSGESKADEIFRLIDEVVEKAYEIADAVFVVSDHGFGKYQLSVNVNSFLAQLGLVTETWRKEIKEQFDLEQRSRGDRKGVRLPASVHRWILARPALKSVIKKVYKSLTGKPVTVRSPYPDPNLSEAYMPSHFSFGIYVNKTEKTDFIVKKLVGLDSIENAWRRDELYHGPHLNKAPHIFFAPKFDQGYNPGEIKVTPSMISKGLVFDHHPDGILAIRAKGLRPKDLGVSSMFDVAPTILRLLGLPLSSDFDGSPIQDVASQIRSERSVNDFDYLGKWRLYKGIYSAKKLLA